MNSLQFYEIILSPGKLPARAAFIVKALLPLELVDVHLAIIGGMDLGASGAFIRHLEIGQYASSAMQHSDGGFIIVVGRAKFPGHQLGSVLHEG